MLAVNTKLEDFTLLDDEGNDWTLSDHLNKKIVLYFYPKDLTPGCTTQACHFRDSYSEFEDLDVLVVGVSADSVASHQKFKEKKNLPFTLLSDPERKVIKYFGAFGSKNVFGKKVEGILRSTFIIDESGVIEKVYPKASPTKNAAEILEYLSE